MPHSQWNHSTLIRPLLHLTEKWWHPLACKFKSLKKIWSIPVCMAYAFIDKRLSSSMHWIVTARDVWQDADHPSHCHQLTLQLFNTCTHIATLQYHTPQSPTALHSFACHFCTFMQWRTPTFTWHRFQNEVTNTIFVHSYMSWVSKLQATRFYNVAGGYIHKLRVYYNNYTII
jgi:hypothetical protein